MSENRYVLLNQILRYKKTNIAVFFSSVIFSVILAFFVFEKQYTATLSILPAANSSGAIGGQLGALSKLAGLDFGLSKGLSQDMLIGIVNSTRLQHKILQTKFSVEDEASKIETKRLVDFLEIEGNSEREIKEKSLKKIREEVVYMTLDEDNNILYINVTTNNPFLSPLVANEIGKVLNDYVINEIQKEFRQKKQYLNSRLAVIADSIKITETELKRFLEKNVDPTLPDFQIKEIRLKRSLEIQSQLFIELRKQLEVFLATNFMNLSDLKILDKAETPYRKSRPKRLMLLITFVMLFGFLQLGVNGGSYYYKKLRIDLSRNIES